MGIGISKTPKEILDISVNGDVTELRSTLEDIACDLRTMCNLIPPGLYQHYKGGKYIVQGLGRHSEDETLMVSYQSCEDGRLWFRPAYMFREIVGFEGKDVMRFTKIG